ncbi:MAG TPA: HAMP domain-containing sensor histidine kinase [Methanospirillum sp.]|uniref:HAMP domain-containing sensor histidine kinase n=1 Tax=Methanospirillum sp. TaxID=45200 RepID=UPI002C22D09C|nr:HAMP domain-containing sensor histidine kinase [Methanospirillum sp.]HWQ63471.1 HAMP domain-containing sensor histidine kinase [Methanospirillum sp.]
MKQTDKTIRRKLSVLLFVLILISTASVGIGIGVYSYKQNLDLIDSIITSVQQETQDRTEAFFLILAGAEPSIDSDMSSGLPAISRDIGSLNKPVSLVTAEDLKPIADRNNVDDIYLINGSGVIFSTTYPEDQGFDLKTVGLESFLKNIMNSGNISMDRAAVNALNGEITKYAYYSQPGSDYIIETSVQLRKALDRTRSQNFTSFLMDDFLPRIQKENPFVLEIDLFSSNTLSQYSLIHEGKKMDPEIYRQVYDQGEVRILSGNNLTVYTHFRPKEKEADYTGNLTSMVVYDTSMPGRVLFETAWHTFVILFLVTIIAFLISGRLFDRLIVCRLQTIVNDLHRIGGGDYSVKIDDSGTDEFSRIASEINRMCKLLLSREEELKNLNRDQEEIVRIRTAELQQMKDAFEQANIKLKMLTTITRDDIISQTARLSELLVLAGEKAGPDFGDIINESQSVVDTIRNQIEFTQVYDAIGSRPPVWHSIKETVEQAICNIPGTGLMFNLDLGDILVLADPLLEKVLYTLIENTVRHGKWGTSVQFSFEITGSNLILVYEDDGVGIADEKKSGIFIEGFEKNSGFGLFIAREILAITHIAVRETGVYGKGVRFEIRVKEGFWKRNTQ